jgi:hypothetical protein
MLSGAPVLLRACGPLRYVLDMRILLVAIAAAVLIFGCGSAGTGSGPMATPSPSTSSNPMGFDVTVTETTQAASMRVGQKLEVVLHAGSGMNNWTQPRSSDESILAPTVNPAAPRGDRSARRHAGRVPGQSSRPGGCLRLREPDLPLGPGLPDVRDRFLSEGDRHPLEDQLVLSAAAIASSSARVGGWL